MLKSFAVCLATVTLFADARGADLEDGIYSYAYEGTGAKVRRTDGAEVILGKRLGPANGVAMIRSVSNDNSFFTLELKGVGPLVDDHAMPYYLAVIDGLYIAVKVHSEPHADRTTNLLCHLSGSEAAERAATRLKIAVQRSTHPGHRFEVKWTPEREAYHPGEAVTLVMEIRNTGATPFAFQIGGQQRGERDNQYRFLAYGSSGGGKAVPDTGDPKHYGGTIEVQALKPGEAYTAKVDLSKWFTFADPDTYRVTGLFGLRLYNPDDGFGSRTTWNDLAGGDCTFRVTLQEK